MLVELLIYIVSVVAILGAVMYFLVQMYTLYATFVTPARADRIGSSIVAELSKEIRSGARIELAESAFNVPTGFITIDAQRGETELEKYFGLEDGRIIYREHGGEAVYLTPEHISVSGLTFTQLVTPVSYAVRFEVALTYDIRGVSETRTYTGLAIMRHSYD